MLLHARGTHAAGRGAPAGGAGESWERAASQGLRALQGKLLRSSARSCGRWGSLTGRGSILRGAEDREACGGEIKSAGSGRGFGNLGTLALAKHYRGSVERSRAAMALLRQIHEARRGGRPLASTGVIFQHRRRGRRPNGTVTESGRHRGAARPTGPRHSTAGGQLALLNRASRQPAAAEAWLSQGPSSDPKAEIACSWEAIWPACRLVHENQLSSRRGAAIGEAALTIHKTLTRHSATFGRHTASGRHPWPLRQAAEDDRLRSELRRRQRLSAACTQ